MAWSLLGDIGGTNARFALCEQGSLKFEKFRTIATSDHPNIIDAIRTYFNWAAPEFPVRQACIAAAGPVVAGSVKFTNNPWNFSAAGLCDELDLERVEVINDFEAMALSLSCLSADDVTLIGPGKRNCEKTKAILGPGTGLGMAASTCYRGRWVPLATEGGHSEFVAHTRREREIKDVLQEELGFVCNEDVLSGQGMRNLYRSICKLDGVSSPLTSPGEICSAALQKESKEAQECFQLFWAILGSVAGDYALQTGSTGGVYLSGGIAPRYIEEIKRSQFRERFEDKGNYSFYMKDIATSIVTVALPGLIGAASVFLDK